MDQLRFTGLHEDGAHLVVTATDGTDFVVPVDERLRVALRQSAVQSVPRTVAATPRKVQTHIRAGLSAEEVAESTGWTVERIQRYEGPILAERAHVARLGSTSLVRTHDRSGPAPTLEARVRDRLQARGVNTDHVTWDSKRPDGGQWSVQVQFMAGQRARHASWRFDVASRSVEAIDDEARWLSEDEQTLPASAPVAVFGSGIDGPDDLISSMRERSRRRGQTGGRRRKGVAAALDTEDSSASPIAGEQELPLEDLLTAEMGDAAADDDGFLDEHEGDSQDGDNPDKGNHVRGNEDKGSDDHADVDDSDVDDGHTTLNDFFGLSKGDDEDAGDKNDGDENDGDENDGDENDGDENDGDADSMNNEDDDGNDDRGLDPSRSEAPDSSDEYPAPEDTATRTDSSDEPTRSPPSRARKGRPSVPRWDDIMFGARDRKR